MGEDDLRLGRLLVQSGHLREEVLRAVLSEQERLSQTGGTAPRLGQMLVDRGLVPSAAVQAALAEQAQTTLLCVSCRLRFRTSKTVGASIRCPKCGGALRRDDVSPEAPTVKTQAIPPDGSQGSTTTLPSADRPAADVSPTTIQKAIADPSRRLGKVVLLDELGRGGMGIVYRAWQEDLQRVVAVKVAADSDDKTLAARFLREARISSKLRHPNIVTVHELAEANGRPYFTMDYIQGGALDAWFAKKQPLRRVLEIVRTLALALHYAHEQGVVHRDIKPQNVLITEDETPYLTDFGLARHVLSQTNITHTQGVVGTPRYMSPEQAQGMNEEVDARTDVYSLGAVLYEGLTGVPPVDSKEIFGMVDAIVNEPPVPPAQRVKGIPADVDTICLKCLEKAPSGRYPTAKDLADDIDRFLRGEPIVARPVGSLVRGWRAVRRRWLPLSASAALVAILVVGGIALHMRKKVKTPGELAWTELKGHVVEMCKVQDFGRARSGLEDFQPDTSALRSEVEDEKKEVHDEATKAYQDMLAHAPERIKDGKFLEVKKSLDAASKWGFQELTDSANEELQKDALAAYELIDLQVSQSRRTGVFADAKRALSGVQRWDIPALAARAQERLNDVDAQEGKMWQEVLVTDFARLQKSAFDLCEKHTLSGDHDFKEAKGEVTGQAKAMISLFGDWAELRREVEAAEDFWLAAQRGAQKMKGQRILYDSEKNQAGVLTGWAKNHVVVQGPGGKASDVGYELLPPDTLLALARAGGASADSIGLYWLCKAMGFADEAQRFDLDAQRKQTKSERDKLDEVAKALVEARNCWAQSKQKKALDALADAVAGDVPYTKGLLVNKPETVGGRLRWRYYFTQTGDDRSLLLDWGFLGRGLETEQGPSGLTMGHDCILVKNAEARFCAPLRDQGLWIHSEMLHLLDDPQGRPVFGMTLGGYTWYIRDGSDAMSLVTPSGAKAFCAQAGALPSGKDRMPAELFICNQKIWGRIYGRVQFYLELPEPAVASAPALFASRDTTILVEDLQVWGTPTDAWLKSRTHEVEALAGVGNVFPLLGEPTVITNGSKFGACAHNGAWSPIEDAKKAHALRGEGADGAPATISCEGKPNVRVILAYQNPNDAKEAAMDAEVTVWTGRPEASATFVLPGVRTGRSRRVVITVVGASVQCVVDGNISVLPVPGPRKGDGAPSVRIVVRRGTLQLERAELQEIRCK